MLSFALSFKNHILTDSKIISIVANVVDRENDQDEVTVVDSLDNVYNETEKAYKYMAELSGMQSMGEILNIFVQMCISNLMTNEKSE